jgi:hypothetical protein
MINYTTYVAQIANLMALDSTTADFQTMLPGMIDYAEQRIYRELDLLSTVVRDNTGALTALNRNFTLPTTANGPFVTVQGINVITPVSTTADSGTRVALRPVSRDYLDMVWNSASGATVPDYFAMIDQEDVILGPWPDSTYGVEVIGTIRPNPLSSANTTTFLTNYLPDLFIAASMVFGSGYMRNFGSQADQPQMSSSWETQTQELMASAGKEELRKKFASYSWTSLSTPKPQAEH